MKYWAGIGSRSTPPKILGVMTRIASKLSSGEYILRSGGAKGADTAFENGAFHKEIFYANDATPEAIELASQYHPAWDRCSDYAKKLHGRNMMILLGRYLDSPVEFIVCWTKDGRATGGTGQALRAAKDYNIRITNLFYPDQLQKALDFIK